MLVAKTVKSTRYNHIMRNGEIVTTDLWATEGNKVKFYFDEDGEMEFAQVFRRLINGKFMVIEMIRGHGK